MPPKSEPLVAPVAYLGGKSRIAKQIVDIIWDGEDKHYYDICCGSGAISIELFNRGARKITMVDAGPWGRFWQMIGRGLFDIDGFQKFLEKLPSRELMQSHFQKLAKQDARIDTLYTFLVLQAAAFGSKPVWIADDWKTWVTPGFRSYWQPTTTSSRRSPVNPMMPMPETLLTRVRALLEMRGIKGFEEDAKASWIEPSAVVYIDPPYGGTTGYGHELDVEKFAKSLPNRVYVSEGRALSGEAHLIAGSAARAKGGITGKKKKTSNEEWLSVFRGDSGGTN